MPLGRDPGPGHVDSQALVPNGRVIPLLRGRGKKQPEEEHHAAADLGCQDS